MTRRYSEDLRERALKRAEAGETIRLSGLALEISPSGVSKWRQVYSCPGKRCPGKILQRSRTES